MAKKLVLSVLFVGLVAVLLVGAINRTSARLDVADRGAEQSSGQQNTRARGQGNDHEAERSDTAGVGTLTVQGTAIGVSDESLQVQTSSSQVLIEGRAWSYALDQGFSAQVNDTIRIAGFYEDGEFKASMVENLTTGQSVAVRDAQAHPLWSGGRRGG